MSPRLHPLAAAVLGLCLVFAPALPAEVFEARSFPDELTRIRYQDLIEELRCLVCQNQNVADSDADLAADLRGKVHELLLAGRSDAEPIDAGDLPRVTPGLGGVEDEHAGELELGMTGDSRQGLLADLARGPLDHAIRHRRTSKTSGQGADHPQQEVGLVFGLHRFELQRGEALEQRA